MCLCAIIVIIVSVYVVPSRTGTISVVVARLRTSVPISAMLYCNNQRVQYIWFPQVATFQRCRAMQWLSFYASSWLLSLLLLPPLLFHACCCRITRTHHTRMKAPFFVRFHCHYVLISDFTDLIFDQSKKWFSYKITVFQAPRSDQLLAVLRTLFYRCFMYLRLNCTSRLKCTVASTSFFLPIRACARLSIPSVYRSIYLP